MSKKLSNLKPVTQPPRVEPEWKLCAACNAFRAECYVPIGEGSAQMCWLCAHAVVEHDAPVSAAHCHECECTAEEIYPHRYPGALLVGKAS